MSLCLLILTFLPTLPTFLPTIFAAKDDSYRNLKDIIKDKDLKLLNGE